MYILGEFPEGREQNTIPSDYELKVDDIIYIEVGHRVHVHTYPQGTPAPSIKDFEKKVANRLWNKIKKEGHQPLSVQITTEDTEYKYRYQQFVNLVHVYTTVCERYVFIVKHASPFAITIAVGWAVVVLVGLFVAWITSPYWGPILWRIAGYEPGEVPPAPPPPPFPGGDIGFILIAIVLILAFVFMFRR